MGECAGEHTIPVEMLFQINLGIGFQALGQLPALFCVLPAWMPMAPNESVAFCLLDLVCVDPTVILFDRQVLPQQSPGMDDSSLS